MLQDLIKTVVQELRLPDFIPDRCVHSHCETAQCRACVDSCPQDAWVLDDEQLGIIPERCDSCGLCVPACSEAAIETDSEPFKGTYRDINILLAACSRSLSSSSKKGVIPCLQSIGIREILSAYRQGFHTFLMHHSDCDECFRGSANRIENRISQLNKLLLQRGLHPVIIRTLTKSNWLALREKILYSRVNPVSRRNFLRQAAANMIENRISSSDADRPIATGNSAPGRLLPTSNTTDMQFCFPVIDADKCNACHACVRLCPHKAIELVNAENNGYAIKADLCTGCQLCVDGCDQGAVAIDSWKTPQTLFLPLQKHTCDSCGVDFFIATANSDPGRTNSCVICRQTTHHSRLFQVIRLEDNQQA